jgi:Helix-turn-helix domain
VSIPVLLTVEDVAERLHVSRRWVLDYVRGRPIGRMAGRKRLFTEIDLTSIIAGLPCPSSSSRRAKARARIGRCEARTSGSELTKLRERLTGNSPRRPFSGYKTTLNEGPLLEGEIQHLPPPLLATLMGVAKDDSSCG